jgi:Cu2+-containing amine oxidase
VWQVDEQLIASEREGRLDHDHAVWKVINPNRRNAFGEASGYVIESHGNVEPLLDKADYERAGFIAHPLWITAHHLDERYAAGDTSRTDALAEPLAQARATMSLVNRDIVAWLSVGFHRAAGGDWPVLSRERLSFELKPSNFFDATRRSICGARRSVR